MNQQSGSTNSGYHTTIGGHGTPTAKDFARDLETAAAAVARNAATIEEARDGHRAAKLTSERASSDVTASRANLEHRERERERVMHVLTLGHDLTRASADLARIDREIDAAREDLRLKERALSLSSTASVRFGSSLIGLEEHHIGLIRDLAMFAARAGAHPIATPSAPPSAIERTLEALSWKPEGATKAPDLAELYGYATPGPK